MDFDVNKLPNGTKSVLLGKMNSTIVKIEGYLQEANGDYDNDVINWSSAKILNTFVEIKKAFYSDISNLANDIDAATKSNLVDSD